MLVKRAAPGPYKWRQRRREPPVGVIVAEPNELYRDDTANLLNVAGMKKIYTLMEKLTTSLVAQQYLMHMVKGHYGC